MFRKRDSVERVQVVLCREVVLVDVGQTTGLIYLFLNQFINPGQHLVDQFGLLWLDIPSQSFFTHPVFNPVTWS